MKLTRKLLLVALAVFMMLSFAVISHAEDSEDGVFDVKAFCERFNIDYELVQKESIADEKCNRILDEWSINGGFSDYETDFPSFYGGAFIDEDKNLVIQVTNLDDEVIKYFESLIDTNDVIFQEVKYSYNELLEQMDAISQSIGTNSRMSSINGVSISQKNNQVNIYYSPDSARSIDISNNLDDIFWIDNIRFIEKEPEIPCEAGEPGTQISVNGINNNGEYYSNSRSIGFWAKDSYGNYGIVTAPHTTTANGMSASINSVTFGEVTNIFVGGSVDCAFIKRTNSNFTYKKDITPLGMHIAGYVTRVNEGITIYTVGVTTGLTVGTVLNSNASIMYEQNDITVSLTDTVKTSNMVNSGDSGGIALKFSDSGIYIAGIVISKSHSNNGDAGQATFCKYTNIASALGVNMI